MKLIKMKIAILLLTLVSSAYGYKILCLQLVPSRSHFLLMMGLVNPLLEAGHQITLITTYPEIRQPKEVKVIDVSHIVAFNKVMAQSDRTKQGISVVKEFARNISLGAIETPAVREVLIKEQFDAVITEWFFSEIEAGYAAIQQVPWIMLGGMVMHTNIEYLIDQVRTVPTIPSLKSQASIPMNFFERLSNTKDYLLTMSLFWKDYPLLKSDYESQFYPLAQSRGVSLPPVLSSMHNISVLLINSHPSFAHAQSLPPNVIDIAGYHVDPKIPPLPKDLQDILDSSTHGVIYFSMGSVFKTSELPEYTNQNILKVFKELEKYTVLWKYDGKFDNLPKNVHVRSWMPQSSILAHPNVKIFITHGGLLSTMESLQFGIPLIAIPVFGDQPSNARRSEKAGHALVVKLGPNMDIDLKEKLNIMLNNDSYYNKAKYISKLFNRRPVLSQKLIQHYVELAIESKGAYHLRSKSHLYAWYELWMLDQLAFVLLIIYVIYTIIKKLLNLILSPSSSSPKKIGKEKKKKH